MKRGILIVGWIVPALIAAMVLAPVGCGGGGTNSLRSASGLSGQPRPSSGSSGPIYEATGKVTLPTSSKLVLTKLTINSCIDTEPIAANGTFKVGVLGDGLSSAFVEDSSGDAIMAGYVDPSKDGSPWAAGKGTVNTPTTALYLLFYSCGGFTLPPGDTVATLASLAKLSQIPTLASAISARIVANPLALVDKDSKVVAAVAAATQAIEKAAGAGRAVPPAQQTTQTITVRVKKPSVQGAFLALVTPGQQDGITPMITSTDTGATLSFQNTYRRRCAAFAYETAIETQSDTSPQAITPVPMVTTKTGFYPAAYTTLGEPQPTVPAFTIAPANALHGVVGSVVDLIMHYGAFTPVTTDGMNLVVDPTLKETDFTIVVLGPSENADNFDQTDLKPLSKYIPDWQNTIGALTLTTTALDVLIPLAYSVPGAEDFGPEFGQFTSPVLGDAMNAAASLPDTVASYKSGDEKGFADSCYQNLADSGSWRDNLVKNFMTEFYKGYSATPTQAQIEKIDSYCEEGGKLLAVADYVLLAADVSAIVWAAYHTNPADVWTAKIDVGKCGAPPASITSPAYALEINKVNFYGGQTGTITIKVPAGIPQMTFLELAFQYDGDIGIIPVTKVTLDGTVESTSGFPNELIIKLAKPGSAETHTVQFTFGQPTFAGNPIDYCGSKSNGPLFVLVGYGPYDFSAPGAWQYINVLTSSP